MIIHYLKFIDSKHNNTIKILLKINNKLMHVQIFEKMVLKYIISH